MAKIEGLDDCLRWLDSSDEIASKVAKKAMRAGVSACTRRTKRNMQDVPSEWRDMVKGKVSVLYNGKLNAAFGMFNGHQRNGHQNPSGAPIDDWFKAYWKNYGTLTHRDPQHRFENPVKPASTAAAKRRRNNVGQPAVNFFENATAGYESTFVDAFEKSLDKQEKTLLGL